MYSFPSNGARCCLNSRSWDEERFLTFSPTGHILPRGFRPFTAHPTRTLRSSSTARKVESPLFARSVESASCDGPCPTSRPQKAPKHVREEGCSLIRLHRRLHGYSSQCRTQNLRCKVAAGRSDLYDLEYPPTGGALWHPHTFIQELAHSLIHLSQECFVRFVYGLCVDWMHHNIWSFALCGLASAICPSLTRDCMISEGASSFMLMWHLYQLKKNEAERKILATYLWLIKDNCLAFVYACVVGIHDWQILSRFWFWFLNIQLMTRSTIVWTRALAADSIASEDCGNVLRLLVIEEDFHT